MHFSDRQLFVFLSFFLMNCVMTSPIFARNGTKCVSSISTTMLQKQWLLGEYSPGGFCNQLFGIFSFIPFVRLLNLTGLIIGPVYSRKSFTVTFEGFLRDFIELPFSYFFDIDFFKIYWSKRGLEIVERKSVDKCLNLSAAMIVDRPRWLSFPDGQLMNMVKQSKIKIPIQENGIAVQLRGHHKFTALYNYLQSGGELIDKKTKIQNYHMKQLSEMYSSLVPSKRIRYRSMRVAFMC